MRWVAASQSELVAPQDLLGSAVLWVSAAQETPNGDDLECSASLVKPIASTSLGQWSVAVVAPS